MTVKAHIYAKCREKGCTASLRYRNNGHCYVLTTVHSRHTHSTHPTKTLMFRAIEDYLATMPKGATLMNLKHAVCTSFGITPKQFYYVVARMNKQQPTLEEYIALIEKEGFEVYVSTE
jgi:hypothetical protein